MDVENGQEEQTIIRIKNSFAIRKRCTICPFCVLFFFKESFFNCCFILESVRTALRENLNKILNRPRCAYSSTECVFLALLCNQSIIHIHIHIHSVVLLFGREKIISCTWLDYAKPTEIFPEPELFGRIQSRGTLCDELS